MAVMENIPMLEETGWTIEKMAAYFVEIANGGNGFITSDWSNKPQH